MPPDPLWSDVIKTLPKIIVAASASTLGILALIILVLGALAYVYFKAAPVKIRIWIFAALLLGAGLYASSIATKIKSEQKTDLPQISTNTATEISGTVLDSDGGVIELVTISSPQGTSPVLTNTDGVFHLPLIIPKESVWIALRIAKRGYKPQNRDIRPPIPNSMRIVLDKLEKTLPEPTLQRVPGVEGQSLGALKFEIDSRAKSVQAALDRIGSVAWRELPSNDHSSTAWAGSALSLVPMSLDKGSVPASQMGDKPFLSLVTGIRAADPSYPQASIERSINAYNNIKRFCDGMPSYTMRDDPSKQLSVQQVTDAVATLRDYAKALAVQ